MKKKLPEYGITRIGTFCLLSLVSARTATPNPPECPYDRSFFMSADEDQLSCVFHLLRDSEVMIAYFIIDCVDCFPHTLTSTAFNYGLLFIG